MRKQEELNAMVYARILETRAKAVEMMTWAEVSGKEGGPAHMAATELAADMQRMMHNQFEV